MALEEGHQDKGRLSITAMELIASVEDTRKVGIFARICWAVCQCVMDNEYQETISNDDSQEDQLFLPPQSSRFSGRPTLILDLDETLIHSSVSAPERFDFSFTLEAEESEVFVSIRPGVPEFLDRVAQLYEVVIFTASMQGYADPLIDQIDPYGCISARLFRPHCRLLPFGYLKDLSRIGRDLKRVLIIDNCPQSYALHPGNAIPITSWFDDRDDHELLDLLPLLERLAHSPDVVKDLSVLHLTKKPEVLEIDEATLRIRSGLSPNMFKTSRLNRDDEETEEIPAGGKRCMTDGGVYS